jgi:ADP-L-glycero-D-manno-heptose 6-epimerase
MHHRKNSGIYNLGSGKARSFKDLAHSTFSALSLKSEVEFIPTPIEIREGYQYFTEANMHKLKSIGYSSPFYELESGIKDYVVNFLSNGKIL